MNKQLNKQIKKDTAAEQAKKREQERQRQEKLAETSRLSRYRRRSCSRSYSRSPPRRYRRSRSPSRSRGSRRYHSSSRSRSRSPSHTRSRSPSRNRSPPRSRSPYSRSPRLRNRSRHWWNTACMKGQRGLYAICLHFAPKWLKGKHYVLSCVEVAVGKSFWTCHFSICYCIYYLHIASNLTSQESDQVHISHVRKPWLTFVKSKFVMFPWSCSLQKRMIIDL